MIVYPAIDIKDGACVRLSQGKFDEVCRYTDKPYTMAEEFVRTGAHWIHTVDLDGARDGERKNAQAIKEIVQKAGDIPVQIGGGVRDMLSLEKTLALGVRRVVIGTAAVNNPAFVQEAVRKYGDHIAVGIDAKDGFAATHGWEQVSRIKAVDLAKQMEDYGVGTIIYTDIATDGMLQGPNVAAMQEMSKAVSCDIIASGGVSCKDDVLRLKETGVAGVIIGKAIYAGRINLEDVILSVE
ncbi:MAG: 1-(5-phosphoribosyl)-5-[(5-phosphoribosylamino)methylideneamino]imidazole-4-carboxamide isomerase [Clostridia bacterium]|nr:1-(5-phosphoribosyl)-5-[(5-phosphoribosylamino)methylideneamino]imidazole-4-carboxamide isomerase [Clostridia bacterium]